MPVLSKAEGAHRPFTRRQALQNRAFLEALRATGNPRLAADLIGVHRSTYTKRRAKSPAFASAWDAALAAAHASFNSSPGFPGEGDRAERGGGASLRTKGGLVRRKSALRTEGGELVVGRTRGGRLQLRRAPAGWMTKAGEQAFFRALSATANVRLSAAAAGFTHSAFYQRRGKRTAFAREMRLALEMGYDRVEAALLEAGLPGSHEDDAWRHNDPPPIPPMTPNQALQLLYLHEKSVRQGWDRPHRRRRRGESEAAYVARLGAMWRCEKAIQAEDAEIRRAAREGSEEDFDLNDAPPLPALEQVTGWSRAALEQRACSERDGACRPTGPQGGTRLPVPDPDPGSRDNGPLAEKPHVPESGPVYNPDRALFGGWRLEDWERRKRRRS